MSRRQTTNYNRFERLRSAVGSVFSRAEAFKLTHAQTLEDLTTKVYQNPEAGKLTGYYQGYLRGLIDAQWGRLNSLTEWRLGPVTGPTRTAGEPWTDEMSTLCRIPGALYGAHFWIGSDRLYGEWKCTNEARDAAPEVSTNV